MLEKHIEYTVCQHAKNLGCLVYKFSSPARAAVPDRMLIAPGGRVFFIEFKQTGKKPTVPQKREIGRLVNQGVVAVVIDNVVDGKAFVESMVNQ